MTDQRPAREMIKVVIVDDDLFVRETLTEFLSAAPDIDVVATCSDGADALTTVRQHLPDVVLMDLRMQMVDGVTATRQIVNEFPEITVLALTSFDDQDAIREMFASGARGFLLKTTRARALVNAIRAAYSGVAVIPADAVRHWPDRRASSTTPALGPREWDLLECLDSGLTNAEISKRLFISHSSVKRDLAALMRKLDAVSRTQVVARAHALGLLPRVDR